MSEVSNTPKNPDSWIASFGAWAFCSGLFGGFWIGYVIARLTG